MLLARHTALCPLTVLRAAQEHMPIPARGKKSWSLSILRALLLKEFKKAAKCELSCYIKYRRKASVYQAS